MKFKIDKDIALLYGILLGDGCLCLFNKRKKFITITGSSKQDQPFFEHIIHPILKKLRGKDTNLKLKKGYNAIEFNFHDKNLFDFLHSLGFPIGKKADRIFIPKIFYRKRLIKYVIQGFIATDGSLVLTKNPNKYYPRIEAHACCKKVLIQICNHLNEIGMKGAFYKARRKTVSPSGFNEVHPKFRFQFNGKRNLLIFNDKIGFINPAYKNKFDHFIAYDNKYDIWRRGDLNSRPLAHETNAFGF